MKVGWSVFIYIAMQLIMIKSNIYFVSSDDLAGYMFRPLGGHLQATEVNKYKITFGNSFWYGWIEISIHGYKNEF